MPPEVALPANLINGTRHPISTFLLYENQSVVMLKFVEQI